jgi:hypothetical protein
VAVVVDLVLQLLAVSEVLELLAVAVAVVVVHH